MKAYLLIFCIIIFSFPALAQQVRISNMDAFNFGMWTGGTLRADDPTCVYKSSGNNRYVITVTDNSTITPNAFHLENPTRTIEIPFEVRWRNRPTSGGSVVSYGVPTSKRRANQNSELCTVGGLSSNLRVRILRADLEAAPGGYYSSELQILVQPQ